MKMLKDYTASDLVSYITDCHGLQEYELREADINPKSKADVMDAIRAYGWEKQCLEYLA
jgi:hypothetical protein